jgi:hypothetical protein
MEEWSYIESLCDTLFAAKTLVTAKQTRYDWRVHGPCKHIENQSLAQLQAILTYCVTPFPPSHTLLFIPMNLTQQFERIPNTFKVFTRSAVKKDHWRWEYVAQISRRTYRLKSTLYAGLLGLSLWLWNPAILTETFHGFPQIFLS